MDEVVEFLTSKGGVFAAVVAVVALAAALNGIVRPILVGRKEQQRLRPVVRFSHIVATNPPPYSEAGEATFQIMNSGGGKAVLSDLFLVVIEHGSTDVPELKEGAAPVPEFIYTVTLSPSITHYDVRHREFGPPPPHSYEAGEVESLRIELRSSEPQWYELEFDARWYEALAPEQLHESRSERVRVELADRSSLTGMYCALTSSAAAGAAAPIVVSAFLRYKGPKS